MTRDDRFGGLDVDDDAGREQLEAIQAECFRAPVEGIARGTERAGLDQVRVVREGHEVVAGLWRVPMGQAFGGRAVSTVGIGAVGTHAAVRGRGSASLLMEQTILELADAGVPLSTLYPATVPLYRKSGYELAGGRYRVELPLNGLSVRAVDPPLRQAGEDDFPAMEACAEAYALEHDGHLLRGHYCWSRLREGKDDPVRHYVVEEDGAVTGALSVVAVSGEGGHRHRVLLREASVLTAGASRRVTAFLATQGSMVGSALTYAAPQHPLLTGVPEWHADVRLDMPWMLRVVDVPAALTARGWPAGVDAELSFAVDDPLVTSNTGPWRLRVADGRATVERGGDGRLHFTIGGLAAWYSGFQTPADLLATGRLAGPPEDLALARGLTAGPPPSMIDMF